MEFIKKINNFKKIIPKYKNNFNNKGIIICTNDESFISSIICIENIIKINPSINIELYYCGNDLFEYQKKYISDKYNNINLINCLDKIPRWYPESITDKHIKGYIIKSYALLITSFTDVLLLDSYNIPIINIEELFNNSDYIKYGNIFWKDLTYDLNINGDKEYTQFNINKSESLTELGQILININKCWDAICLSYYLYFNYELYYKLFNSDKDLYYIAFQLTNTFYYQNKFNPIPCTCNDNNYSNISCIIQRNPLDGCYAFINRIFSKININNYSKIIFIYDDTFIINIETNTINKDIESLKNKYSQISTVIKKVDIFNIIILSKLKDICFTNKDEIINNYNNIIQNNIIYLSNKFKLVNSIELENTLYLLSIYTKYNIFHLNSYCILYILTLRYTESFIIINKIYDNKIYNNESLSILIYLFIINFNLDNFNLIIKLLDDRDLFIFLFNLFNNKQITINMINDILLPKKKLFYDNFLKIFNLDNINDLNNNLDKLLSNKNIIPKFNTPIYFNYFYMLSFKNNNNLSIKQKLSELNRLLFPCLNYIKPNNNVFNIKKNKKIGFISTNLRSHSVGRDRIGIIRNLNHDLFDVTVYYFDEYPEDIYFNLLKISIIKNTNLKGDINNLS